MRSAFAGPGGGSFSSATRSSGGAYNGPVSKCEPVWLVGMMGSGKSTLAPLLAERLGRTWVDVDSEVERREGRSVAAIFERRGEGHFRKLESECIADLETGSAVVALGGGAMAQEGICERLLRTGTVVYLQARPEVLLARIADEDTRPLLRDLDRDGRLRRLESLLSEREPAYLKAHLKLDTNDGFGEESLRDWSEALRVLIEARKGRG